MTATRLYCYEDHLFVDQGLPSLPRHAVRVVKESDHDALRQRFEKACEVATARESRIQELELAMKRAEECRQLCAWKGGFPCAVDWCPRRAVPSASVSIPEGK